ncbi:hypothetical protein BJX65DRAFT_305522 [Aspergillus insuetus]
MSTPLLPPPSAPASTVRTYITQTLITTHSIPRAVSEHLAEKWDIGRGYEFRHASRDHLQRVFGDNAGLCLYHAIREARSVAASVELTRLQAWSRLAADITGLLLAGVVILRFMPNVLGLRDRRDPIMWAANPSWWLAFGACAVNSAYQQHIQNTKDGLILVGGCLAFLVGVELAKR